MSERNPASRYSVSLEMRFHFRHDGCRAGPGGWSLADANLGRAYFCPWCGQQLEPPKPAGADDSANRTPPTEALPIPGDPGDGRALIAPDPARPGALKLESLQRAVAIAGGQVALAKAIGLKQGHIWWWLNKTKQASPGYVLAIEEATGVSKHDLRPDIFGPDPNRADLQPNPILERREVAA